MWHGFSDCVLGVEKTIIGVWGKKRQASLQAKFKKNYGELRNVGTC